MYELGSIRVVDSTVDFNEEGKVAIIAHGFELTKFCERVFDE